MIPTPDLSHLKRADYESIYEPAEDTFILLDAVEQDQEELRLTRPLICLEIGCGSGCVSAFLASVIGSPAAAYFCTDVNPLAAQATVRTGAHNKAIIMPVIGDLHYPFASRLAGQIDVLLFNPPYVETEDEEGLQGQTRGDLSATWAGGAAGMATTTRLIEAVPHLLSPTGRFYLVAIRQNQPESLVASASALGLQASIVLKRRAGGEVLYVLRFTRLPSS